MTLITPPQDRNQLSPRGDPVRRRAGPGGQRRHLDRRRFVPAQRHRSGRHPERLLAAGRVIGRRPAAANWAATTSCIDHKVLRRTRNSQGILIGTARANPGQATSRTRRTSTIPSESAPLRTVYDALRSLRRRRPDLDRRRRHAQDGQQVQAVSGPAAARQPAHSGRASAQDDRQRLHGHRLHVRLLHGRRHAGQRNSQPAGRRRGEPRATSWPRRWAAAPAGWPTARPSPAKPAW